MSKTDNLVTLAQGLQSCGEALVGIAQQMLTSKPVTSKSVAQVEVEAAPQVQVEDVISLENVRAVCAEKSRAGYTGKIKELLTAHGGDRLSAIDPREYKALLKEVEELL